MKYKESGVNIDKANEANKAMSESVRSTWGSEVLSDVGHFGGLFKMPEGYKDPVLVSSMDGVGTKLLVAQMVGRFDTIGQDLVNHCVNDILVQGGTPLFFLDYLATGSLNPAKVSEMVGGLSLACKANGCALIGGETAEMPGLYQGEDFDLAGTIVGIVERKEIIDGSEIRPGDTIFALPSNGLHTNGYSLVRQVIFEKLGMSVDDHVDEFGCTVGDELLKIHLSYLEPVSQLRTSVGVKGLAHITGGGVIENLPRILPAGCGAKMERGTWPVPPVFEFLRKNGGVNEQEMFRVFNMGLGMLIVVGAANAEKIPERHESLGVYKVGEITAGDKNVDLI